MRGRCSLGSASGSAPLHTRVTGLQPSRQWGGPQGKRGDTVVQDLWVPSPLQRPGLVTRAHSGKLCNGHIRKYLIIGITARRGGASWRGLEQAEEQGEDEGPAHRQPGRAKGCPGLETLLQGCPGAMGGGWTRTPRPRAAPDPPADVAQRPPRRMTPSSEPSLRCCNADCSSHAPAPWLRGCTPGVTVPSAWGPPGPCLAHARVRQGEGDVAGWILLLSSQVHGAEPTWDIPTRSPSVWPRSRRKSPSQG